MTPELEKDETGLCGHWYGICRVRVGKHKIFSDNHPE